jgi:hypothetical protein
MGDKKDENSWGYIIALIIVAFLIFIWNYVMYCTPAAAFREWSPKQTGLQKNAFPFVSIYYSVVCTLFWVVPFLLLIKASNMTIKKLRNKK